MDLKEFLTEIKAKKQIDKLVKKYRNKKIILYGAGEFLRVIMEIDDLSRLNIVGISDSKFEAQKASNFTKYPAIAPSELKNYDFDCIFTTFLQDRLQIKTFEQEFKNCIVRPLVMPSFFQCLSFLTGVLRCTKQLI